NQRKKGNDIDNLWFAVENEMFDRWLNEEKKKLEILQIKNYLEAKRINPKNQSQILKTIRFWHPRIRYDKNEIERDVSICKKAKKNVKSEPQPINRILSSKSLPSSDEGNKECSEEDDMEIKFDLTIILTKLQREPTVKYTTTTNEGRLKVQLRVQKSINQQLQSKGGLGEAIILLNMDDSMESYSMDLEYDSFYHFWPFLTTRLVVDKTMISLEGAAIHHLVSLE
ncbi:19181_t:CDS:2, partial [Gigaspora margarita]